VSTPRASVRDGTGSIRHHPRRHWRLALPGVAGRPIRVDGPLIVSAILGRPGAIANISASNGDVLGTSLFLIFIVRA
jgi:hypothetical protein